MTLRTINRPAVIAPRFAIVLPRAHPAWITAAFLAVGVVLRLAAYLGNPSLWIDEAMIAHNVLSRDLAGLTRPLDFDQGAPLAFLFLCKFVAVPFGGDEFALRLVPLLCGVASLFVFTWVAFRLVNPFAARVAVALFALSPDLVIYSAEFKQYSSDVLVALLLVAMALTRWRPAAFAAAGAAAVWCSHPALFVLGGVGVYFLLKYPTRPVVLAGAAWLASFASCYVLFLRDLATNDYLVGYWAGSFLAPGDPVGSLKTVYYAFRRPFGLEGEPWMLKGFAAGLFALGALRWLRYDRPKLALVGLPFAFTLAAAALHKYPFAGRMVLFLTPFVYLLLASAVVAVGRLHPRLMPVCLAALFVAPVGLQAKEWSSPRNPEAIRPLLDQIAGSRRPDDTVWVYHWAEPAFRYYANGRFPRVKFGSATRGDRSRVADEVGPLTGRVWLVFSHHAALEPARYREELLGRGRHLRTIEQPGAVAMLFDLSE